MLDRNYVQNILNTLDKKAEEGATKLAELDVTSEEYTRTLSNIQSSLMFSGQIRQIMLDIQKEQEKTVIKFDDKKEK